MPPKKKTAQRTLVAGLTAEQDELLRTVQYRTGMLAGRDSLYLATRQYIEESASDVKQPTKRQIGDWLKGEKGFQRQKTTGAALPKHKPVAIIRRSRPLQYVQADVFQLDERPLKTMVTYTNKKGQRVTVPLVHRYALIAVDVFSRYTWVRLLQTPKGAGVNAAWDGLKTNPDVIGTAKAMDSILAEIDADLQDEQPPRRLKDLNLKAGTDNGNELTSPDIERIFKKWKVRQELGQPGRPMSQSFAESGVGVWKRRFATWVRARMDAVGEDNEESKRAKQIKQSWPDVADTITAAVNTAWMRKHPRPLSRHDVHFGSEAVIDRVREHQKKDAAKRSRAYERDDTDRYEVGDIVRRMVARSGKLDAAWSKRLYKVTAVKRYKKVKRPSGYQIAPVNAPTKREPGLYRAEQLQRVLVQDGKPVENQLSAADADALNDPAAREYTPWRVLDRKGDRILVQWRGYSREDSSWEDAADFPQFVNGGG
eukprot:COSAG02_NODE_2501_length_8672_cov_7.293246_5_plen_482_part_00